MDDDTDLLFDLPSVTRKKVSAAFDGGRITSDGGVALLALADRRIGIVDRLARLVADPRDPALVTHSVASILRARVLAIACGYEDANDLDRLRGDPAFKLARGRLRSVLAADGLALGERAGPEDRHPPDLRAGRRLVRQLRPGARGGHLGHRRYLGRGPRRPAVVAVPRSSRRTLLPADPHL